MRHLIATAVLALAGSAIAENWTVDDDGPADFDNIQAAVDASSDGDEIVVSSGTYTGVGSAVIELTGRSLVIRGVGPAESVVLTGELLRCCVSITEGGVVELSHMSFREGLASSGGGLHIDAATVAVEDCIIQENCSVGFFGGGGVQITNGADVILRDCQIKSNRGRNQCGGISVMYSAVLLENCVLSANYAPAHAAIGLNFESSMTMRDSLLEANVSWHDGPIVGFGHDSQAEITGTSILRNIALGHAIINVGDGRLDLGDSYSCGNWSELLIGDWSDLGGNVFEAICQHNGLPRVIKVPGDYATVQEAACMAHGGDRIVLAPGIHDGPVILPPLDGLTVESEAGAEETELSGHSQDSTIYFLPGAGNSVQIRGLTIRNGQGTRGGGIFCNASSPTITHCIIRNNAAYFGGGIYINGGSAPVIEDCVITNNSGSRDGGGISLHGPCEPFVVRCDISGNSAGKGGGIAERGPTHATYLACDISSNSSGVYSVGSNSRLLDCVFSDNQVAVSTGSPIFSGCTFSSDGGSALVVANGGRPTFANCEVSSYAPVLLTETGMPMLEGTLLCAMNGPPIEGPWENLGWNLLWQGCTDCNDNGVDDIDDLSSGVLSDVDGDGLPDQCEYDCDRDGVSDPIELFEGTQVDVDGNGRPDSCEEDCDGDGIPGPCRCDPDLDGDHAVGVADLLIVLASWGGLDGTGDVDGDTLTTVADLLAVVGAWGTCPDWS